MSKTWWSEDNSINFRYISGKRYFWFDWLDQNKLLFDAVICKGRRSLQNEPFYLWHCFTPEVNPRHLFCFPFRVLSRVTSAITFSSWRMFHFAATIPKTASKWPWQSTTDDLEHKLQLHTDKSPQGAARSSYTIDSALAAANPSGVNLRPQFMINLWLQAESSERWLNLLRSYRSEHQSEGWAITPLKRCHLWACVLLFFRRYFGFITKHPADHRFACHVFVSENSTKPLAESVGWVQLSPLQKLHFYWY